MGLSERLGYDHRPANPAQRALQAAAASRPGAWAMARASAPLDRWAFRVSDGRWTFVSALGGLPVIVLTTTGARTGAARTTPLVGIPDGDDLAVIGSGYGQPSTPGWVHNLRATPEAVASYRGVAVPVVATEPPDPAPIWETARRLYRGYGIYPERASHRQIAVFSLRPR